MHHHHHLHELQHAVAPVSAMYAREMAEAFEALCTYACMQAALTGVLIGRGVPPHEAVMMVRERFGPGPHGERSHYERPGRSMGRRAY